jgi:hypothetical protein
MSNKEHAYTDAELLDICQRLRAARTHVEWMRVQAFIAKEHKASENAAFRLVWGLATGYRKPPPGLARPGATLTHGEAYAVKLHLKNFSNSIENAAAFLGVDVNTYRLYMDAQRSAGRQGLMAAVPPPPPEQQDG